MMTALGKPPRVLIVADAYPSRCWPTANPFIRSQAVALHKLGCGVAIFAPVPYAPRIAGQHFKKFAELPASEQLDGIAIERPRFPRGPGAHFRAISSPMQRFWLRRSFEAMVARFAPSVIHAHMATPAGYVASHWAKFVRLPVCVTLHGLDITTYPNADAHLRRQTVDTLLSADRVIAVSSFVAKQARRLAPSVEPHVCYTGIDTVAFAPNPNRKRQFREQLKLPPDVPVIGVGGRMVEEKGLDDVAAVASLVQMAGHRMAWMLIGDGPARQRLADSLARTVGEDLVFAFGDVAHDAMPDYLRTADILLHLSLNEGFGMVLLEAQACGTPVIAYRIGGIPEATDAASSAILVDPEPNTALRRSACADSLVSVIGAPERMRQMSEAGVAFASGFSIERRASELIAIYAGLRQ